MYGYWFILLTAYYAYTVNVGYKRKPNAVSVLDKTCRRETKYDKKEKECDTMRSMHINNIDLNVIVCVYSKKQSSNRDIDCCKWYVCVTYRMRKSFLTVLFLRIYFIFLLR